MSERRKDKRFPSILPITVRTNKNTLKCVSMNLSRSGIGFISDKVLPPGSVIVDIANSSVKGRILYRKDQGKGTVMQSSDVYHYGVALGNRVSQEELDRWIFTSRMPSRGRAV